MHDPALGEDLRRLGADLTARRDDIGREIAALVREEVPEVWEDEPALQDLLQQVVDSNIENLVTSLLHGVSPAEVKTTTASTVHARRLAQHDVPAHLMVRVYQLAHQHLMRRMLDELGASAPAQRRTIDAIAALLDYGLSYTDAMCQAAVEAHALARDSWSRAEGAATAHRLAAVLAGDVAEPDAASRLLSYDVHGRHLGLVIWTPVDGTGRTDLTAIARRLRRWPGVESMLIVPQDEATVFCWITLPSSSQDLSALDASLGAAATDVRIACGDPGNGLDGFRETHRQARAARCVSELADGAVEHVIHFNDVAAVSFLATRPRETTAWVHQVLGSLAGAGDELRRLRATLRVFLELGENTSDAAVRLSVHRNTVNYRVARARDLLPIPFPENRLNIALALDYCHWVPSATQRDDRTSSDPPTVGATRPSPLSP